MPDWFDVKAGFSGVGGGSLHVVAAKREEEVREVLGVAGFGLRTLEGGLILSDKSFFREVGRALGLPAHFGHNWDALQDVLGDLARDGERRIALLWRGADWSCAASRPASRTACSALNRSGSCLT